MLPLILAIAAFAGPRADARRAERLDPFSPTNLARAVDQVKPLVERVSGRTFTEAPVVELATPEVLRAMILEEQELITASVLRDTSEELRRQFVEDHSLALGGLLGKYGLFEKKLLLSREDIAAVAGGHPVEPIVRVILAHELTHALHDQQVDLAAQVRALADQDALWAASATWEGLATWVSEGVAGELGLRDTWVQLAALQGWSPDGLEETGAYPIWAMYGRGRDAVEWHAAHGGLDRVWSVAARPPASSRGLFDPASWPSERRAPSVDWPAVLRTTEQQLTDGPWVVGISALGEFDLRGEAIVGGTEAAFDEVLAHLTESFVLTASRPDRQGEIRALVFDDPAWPARYLDLLRSQQTAGDVAMAGRLGREIEVRYDPFDEVPADAATLRSSRVAGMGGTATERTEAWVVRGSTLVVVAASGFRPGLRLGWTVEEVFRRLDAARAGSPLPDPAEH